MLFDFNVARSRVAAATYDVCICGAGPAGITLAMKLAAYGKKVALLEGGGLEFTDESQDLYKGISVGQRYWFLQNGRLRYFGGTSNHWEGRCGILDPIDFEPRDYFGMPGWPISREQVLEHLSEAQDILDISGHALNPSHRPDFASPLLAQSGYALSPPTRFLDKYINQIRSSELIDAFYHANLIDVWLNSDFTKVEHLVIRNFAGQDAKVNAKQYILALGAVENARILLNARKQVSIGIGNHSDMVGRCFMEHLNVPIGRFLMTDPQFWKAINFHAAATDLLMRKFNVGNGIIAFGADARPQSYGRLRMVKQFLRETGCALPAVTRMARQIVDFDCPGDGLVTSLIEQVPNPESRVSLSEETDSLGLRRIRLDWRLTDSDRRTVRVLALEAAKEMARLDRARVQLAPFILDPALELEVGGHAHHMGTTRISADPRHGVVDANCCVHGVRNLYVAGSSVFPTGGGTNPTLTIVLLALRLADFLNRQTT